MRTRAEIERAHDLLASILLDDELRATMDPRDVDLKIAAADVLCWVLRHNHNGTFKENLRRLEEFARENGAVLERVQ